MRPWRGFKFIDSTRSQMIHALVAGVPEPASFSLAVLMHPSKRHMNIGARKFEDHRADAAELEMIHAAMRSAGVG